jgi:hypothetical protein
MRFLLAAIMSSLLATAGHATTASVDAVADNTLYPSSMGARSNGIGQHFFAGRTAESDSALRRGLVRFDVGTDLPPDATVLSATLMLHLSTTGSGARPVRVHRVLGAWGEGTSDAPLQEGAGTAATPGDATWIHRVRPSLFWSMPGGDFTPMPSASMDVAGVGDYAWSSPQLAADVQAWVANPGSEFGWILIGDEGFPATTKRFDSRENPDSAVRPRLLVEFETLTSASPFAPTAGLRAHPNPFRDRITLHFDRRPPATSRLIILDTRGRLVRTLTTTEPAWTWDGRNLRGDRVAAGIYIVQLLAPEAMWSRRIIHLR